jgi:hypothetical protein
MAVTAHVFPQWELGAASKLQNLAASGDTLKVALSNTAGPVTLSTGGVQAAALFTDWTSNVAAEISGTGYTAGGATITGQSVAVSGNVMTFTASSNPSWTTSTFSANQAIFYDSAASTVQLICFWDFGGAVTVTASTFTLTISGSGLLTATAS